jgi:hypothetical protein
MVRRIAATILIGILATLPGTALATEHDHSLEQVLVESAQTPADHAALAHHYREEAAAARAEAAKHEQMAKSYNQGKATQRVQMQRHCKSIAESLEKQATEYDSLAALHEAEAKQAK